MRNLHSSIDSGLYECSIAYDDVSFKRSLQVTVIKKAYWEDTKEVVSGIISQPLEINCVARGQPPPDVTIQVLDGLQADRDYVMIDKQKIQIQELKMDHRGLKIQCIATQTSDDMDDNQMTVKWITVDVTYPPVLDSKQQTIFGIKGESLTLPCVVKHSNPKVSKFEFSEISQGIFTDIFSGYGNYSVVVDEGAEAAYLQIPSLEERHFDIAFECKATSNELSSSKKFSIKKRHPPALPFPSPSESTDDRAIVWKLQDGSEETESLSPVTKFKIRYLKSDQIANGTESSSLDGAPEWEEQAYETEFDKRNTDLYSINNLQKSATYYFRFQAVNKAGNSDWSPVFRMATKSVENLTPNAARNSAKFSIFLSFSLFIRMLRR
uniref:Fibronectin type-III domain-containing protein n=1 Tax=Romanomermis culicivorax TaxID=13658 RepID=A0A915HYX7_ROMCU